MQEPEACPLTEAFVLVNTEPNALWKASEEAKKINGIKLVRCLAGRFDMIFQAETANLSWIISRLHALKGVRKTETLLVLRADFDK